MMTILTGIWEFSFVTNYDEVSVISENFLNEETNVWTSSYDLSYVFPWKLSKIFYADYASYGDREYKYL